MLFNFLAHVSSVGRLYGKLSGCMQFYNSYTHLLIQRLSVSLKNMRLIHLVCWSFTWNASVIHKEIVCLFCSEVVGCSHLGNLVQVTSHHCALQCLFLKLTLHTVHSPQLATWQEVFSVMVSCKTQSFSQRNLASFVSFKFPFPLFLFNILLYFF